MGWVEGMRRRLDGPRRAATQPHFVTLWENICHSAKRQQIRGPSRTAIKGGAGRGGNWVAPWPEGMRKIGSQSSTYKDLVRIIYPVS